MAAWIQADAAARFQPGNIFRNWWFDQLMLNEAEHLARSRGLQIGNVRDTERYATDRRSPGDMNPIRAMLAAGAFDG